MTTATAIYAAETCTIVFSPTINPAIQGPSADRLAGLERAAREAMRKDWMSANMQTRPHADLIIGDEVKFDYSCGLRNEHYTARCTGENNVVTILSQLDIWFPKA